MSGKKTYLVFLKQNFKQNVLFGGTDYTTSHGGSAWQKRQPSHRAALAGTPRAGLRLQSLCCRLRLPVGRWNTESLLMAWAGAHKAPIRDRSHLLKPPGWHLLRWLWSPGCLQRAGKYITGHRGCSAPLGRERQAGDLAYRIQSDAGCLRFGSQDTYLVV